MMTTESDGARTNLKGGSAPASDFTWILLGYYNKIYSCQCINSGHISYGFRVEVYKEQSARRLYPERFCSSQMNLLHGLRDWAQVSSMRNYNLSKPFHELID